ncbi:MAG TPA: hypothetical protein VK906_18010 [Egicoccus sp.]|nr:hypothetical protein [Egicoccus sp.]HSK25086.1 hypothetical protein [Egicoccus sp.]
MKTAVEAWTRLLGGDPRPWLLASDEPSARWLTRTALLDGRDLAAAEAERAAVVADPGTQRLVRALPEWGDDVIAGHHSPSYLPNLLHLLADLGLRGGDDPRIEQRLDALEAHQRDDGRFMAFGRAPGTPGPVWGSLPCDTHAITEVLIRFGRGDGSAVTRGLERMAADLLATTQGPGWTCVPDPAVGWRGPGRKGAVCPQVTLEALRTFSRVPAGQRPDGLERAATTMLGVWRRRGTEQPYMFGHGKRFKTVKWPPLWYGSFWLLDTLGRYPSVWGPTGDRGDRASMAELLACLVAYNTADGGLVTPRSVYRGFEAHSFGQKQVPSPFATAQLAAVVRRLSDLVDDATQVDVARLPSSRGGTGVARPPGR